MSIDNGQPDETAGHGHRTADTGDKVASLAGKYGNFTVQDLLNLAASDNTGTVEAFCHDVRSMAASLRRQNER